MKKYLSLIVILLLSGGLVSAQKLAPNAQALLSWPQQEKSLLKNASNAPETMKAFITVNNLNVTDSIVALGGKVSVITDELLTGELPLDALQVISELDGVVYIKAASPVRQLLDEARRVSGVDEAHNPDNSTGKGAFTGKGVIIGIIDSGFEYDHLDFYTTDGTTSRVKRVWNQNSTAGGSPTGYGYGTEYDTVEEMRAAQYDNYSDYHATHVTGIAAGGDKLSPFYGVAPDAELVFVSYRDANTDIMDAIKYIFDYADSVDKPCVINISIGSHYGPHDGTSELDRAIDQLTGPGRIIVGAAGNEAQYNLHASEVLTADDKQLKTMIGYENESTKRAILDVWGAIGKDIKAKAVVADPVKGTILKEGTELSCRNNAGDSHKLEVTSEDCGITGWIGIGVSIDPVNNRPNVFVQSDVSKMATNRRMGIVLTGEEGDEIHVWHSYYGDLLSGRISWEWTAGDNSYTVGEIGGTANRIIAVGSYTTKLSYIDVDGYTNAINPEFAGEINDISTFSSLGPTLDGRIKPDVCAPGAAIISAASRYYVQGREGLGIAAQTTNSAGKSYQYYVNLGTSMAAPFVTGTVALWLQADPTLTPEDVKSIINRSAKRDEYTGTDLPNNWWGAGKLDSYAGLLIAVDPTSVEELEMAMSLLKVTANRDAKNLQFFFADDKGELGLNVKAYDTMGHLVDSYRVNANGQTVSTEGLAHGLYILHVECDGVYRSVKVLL